MFDGFELKAVFGPLRLFHISDSAKTDVFMEKLLKGTVPLFKRPDV